MVNLFIEASTRYADEFELAAETAVADVYQHYNDGLEPRQG